MASAASLAREVAYWSRTGAGGNGREPDVTVIIPMRGVDPGLDDNLARIAGQRYGGKVKYVVAVDSPNDPALQVARRALPNLTVVMSDPGNASGKGSALSSALRAVDTDVVVLCDSDVKPHDEWLRRLASRVSPTTAVTTYRWYIGRSAPALLMANFSSLGLTGMQTEASRFTWGGSTALHMDFIKRSGVIGLLPLYLSDDYLITRKIHELRMKIEFEPSAVVLSLAEDDIRAVFNWAVRQMWYVKVYGKRAFQASLVSYTVMALASLTFLALPLAGWPALISLLIFPMGVAKEYVRAVNIARRNPGHARLIKPLLHAAFSIPNLYFSAIVMYATLATREINWRGRRYLEEEALKMLEKASASQSRDG